MDNPRISIIIPTANVEGKKYLQRCLDSIEIQNYKNYQVIVTEEGKVGYNINQGIKRARGDIIKILCHDDYLNGSLSLEEIAYSWKGGWLVSGCVHDQGDGQLVSDHFPGWNPHIHRGFNTIGGLSILAFENNNPLLFNEELEWTVDIDFYKRAFERYGLPTFLMTPNVTIGYGSHQSTNFIPQEQKNKEINLMVQTYGE